jgi:methylmalonyl-CoA/ethylmalonyl-CoA epimerase
MELKTWVFSRFKGQAIVSIKINHTLMKYLLTIIAMTLLFACGRGPDNVSGHFNHVDQIIWIVDDLDNTISKWNNLGFNQVTDPDTVTAGLTKSGTSVKIILAKGNLGGANVTWIQPLEDKSVFAEFLNTYGEGAMSIVHRMENRKALRSELRRLSGLGVKIKEEIKISTDKGELYFVLADTFEKGKYYLGYTFGDDDLKIMSGLSADNLHKMQINQYAFAIRDPGPVSQYWHLLGQPEFRLSDPVLGNTHYYGEIVDHKLIQGWQREFDVDYEWCIPVKPPIVYDDHIRKHGEGIHHLAFSVRDMDRVLQDYTAKGFVISMGGTWGDEGKPGSGRYEYIDMEDGGGLTMELLWNFE